MQGVPSEVKLATEDQEHTSHTKTKHYKKTRINILEYTTKHKSRTNLWKKKNEVQDRFDKQVEKKRRGFLHAMIMKVPPKTHRIPNFKIIIQAKNFSPKYPTKVSMFWGLNK